MIQDGAGNNTFIVTANTTVDTLTVKGGSGKDELSITADTEDFSFKGGAESDSVLVTGSLTRATVYGGEGNDTFMVDGDVDGSLSECSRQQCH